MEATQTSTDEQAMLWNGVAGRAWVDTQELLDRMLQPFEDLLVDAAAATAGGGAVLDVGCGTGSTTLAVARRLGAQGRCIGIDISQPMIAAARARAARARAAREHSPARFIVADAQTHPFAPASVDRIISRFGVMFFGDPVRAFANLRRAARDGAALRFVAWRSAAENPFMTTAERAASPLLPGLLPARQPDAPGQFAFADAGRVQRILAQSDWLDIDIRPIDVSCTLAEAELIPYLSRLGPLGRVLPELDEHSRERVIATARAAFEPYVQGSQVRFNAACWMVSARAASTRAVIKEGSHV